MSSAFYFNRTRLRYIKNAITIIATYRPDGKDAAYVQTLIAGMDTKNSTFVGTDQTLALARGEFHERVAEGHKLCVKIYPIMKSRYREDEGSLAAINRLPTEDKTPDETKSRMEDMSVLWTKLPLLPNPPGPDAAFLPWPGMTQVVFEAARVAIGTEEGLVSNALAPYELAQGELNKAIGGADVFGTQATIQGRAQFDPGTPERDVIDRIPTTPAAQAPSKAVITAVSSPAAGQIEVAYDALHGTSWDVLVKAPGATDYVVAVNDTIEQTATITGLAAGTYSVEVRGRNSRGDGPVSDPHSVAVT